MILQTEQLIGHIQAGIEEKKGRDIVVADFSNIPEAICQAFVICTGNSPTHLQALTDSVEEFECTVGGDGLWYGHCPSFPP